MTQIFDSLQVGLEKVAEFAEKNLKLVLGLFFGLLILGAGWAGLSYKNKTQEVAGFSDLSALDREYNNWKMAQSPDPSATEKPPEVNTEKLFSDLAKMIQSKPDLKASQMAALMLADLGFTIGKEKEVLEVMQSLKPTRGNDLLSAIATLKKGDLQANQNQCDQALVTWSGLLKVKDNLFIKDMVHLKSGLCEEKLSQKEKALGHYNSIIEMKDLKADRWAFKEAQKYKRALTWSQN